MTTPISACTRVNSSIHSMTRWNPVSTSDRRSTNASGRSTELTPDRDASSSTCARVAASSGDRATSAAMSVVAGTCRLSTARSSTMSPRRSSPERYTPATLRFSAPVLVKVTGTEAPTCSPISSANLDDTSTLDSSRGPGAGPTHVGFISSPKRAMSKPVMRTGRAPTQPRPICQPLAAVTGSRPEICATRSSGRPPLVNVPESTTRSARTRSRTWPSTEWLNDERNTARPDTTAVARISAAAVAAVRERWRATSRAAIVRSAGGRRGSTPTKPDTRPASSSGVDPSAITATATPRPSDTGFRPASPRDTSRAAARPTTTATIAVRSNDWAAVRGTGEAPWPTASIGGTRQARTAGTTAATTVAIVPMTTAHTSAGIDTADPATGTDVFNAPRAPSISRPSSSPRGAPSTEASSASSAASARAENSS